MNSSADKLRGAKLFLLDMDGTLCLGDDVIPGAVEFVESLSASGRNCMYLTNNSSRAGIDYVNRLCALGFPAGIENIFTSGMAASLYLNEHHPGAGVYAVGTSALLGELKSYGIRLSSDSPDIVLAGFDRELTYEKLDKACFALRHGAEFYATNPDLVCPMPHGESLPDCGSICALLTAATGKEPFYIGKPNRIMVDIISSSAGVSNECVAVVGDRLYTDIAVGVNSGAVSVLVLSGETDMEMLEASPIKPDYIFKSVAELAYALT